MMDPIRNRLGFRIFASFFLVTVIGMGVVWITTRFTSPRAYQKHLSFMEQRMQNANGKGRGAGPGQPGGMMNDFFDSYQESFNESLILAVGAATLIGLVASWLLSASVVSPLRDLTKASRRISEGHYAERVPVRSGDELGTLAAGFNIMAEKLEQVEAMRRQLIGDVAHELRTPLSTIRGYTEGLADGVLPAAPETFAHIQLETERLTRLVEDLQELSRVEAGAVELNIRPVEAAQLIETAVQRAQYQFEKKGVALSANAPTVPIRVLADVDRTLQVLANLLNNAHQYTSPGGMVEIRVEAPGDTAHFSVRDSGAGIAPEHLPLIFDRFYRVDKSRSRSHGGSGIGLTIARRHVEAQGGRIWVESAGENQGSTFTFTLPVCTDHPSRSGS
jgi:histidine kinase